MSDKEVMASPPYRKLDAAEQEMVEALWAMERLYLALAQAIKAKVPAADKRWLAIAQTDIEKGLMAARRAVTRPEL
jgi:hypothetical protein